MSSRYLFFLLIGFLSLQLPAAAQNGDIDSIISDLYSSISFDNKQAPDYAKFKSLFIDGGKLISVKDTTSYTLTPGDYEQTMSRQRESGKIIAFKEKELHRETDKYGKILHVFSTYQTQLKTPEGNRSARGINSIQLMKTKGKWKVVSLIWYEEDEGHPLPDKYLPGGP